MSTLCHHQWKPILLVLSLVLLLVFKCYSSNSLISLDSAYFKPYSSLYISSLWETNESIDRAFKDLPCVAESSDLYAFEILGIDSDTELNDHKNNESKIPDFKGLMVLIGKLKKSIEKQGSDYSTTQIKQLRQEVLLDIMMVSYSTDLPAMISSYSFKYRLACHRLSYFFIMLSHNLELYNSGNLDQSVLDDMIDVITFYLDGLYSSGLVNAHRKNFLTNKYPLVEKILSHLILKPQTLHYREMIERVLIASRAGEHNNNRRLLSTAGAHAKVLSRILYQIEPLETTLRRKHDITPARLLRLIYKRNILRDKYLTVFEDFKALRKTQQRLTFDINQDETLMVFFEGASKMYEYVANDATFQLIAHDRVDLTDQIKQTISMISNVSNHFRGTSNNISTLNYQLQLLRNRLIDSINQKLRKKIVIDSDGGLTALPLEILRDEYGELLLDKHEVSYVRSNRKSNDILEIEPSLSCFSGHFEAADLILNNSQEEIDYIRKSIDPSYAVGKGVLNRSTEIGEVLHISTHQVHTPEDEPVFLLSASDSIYRRDFFTFSKAPKSMTLSACATHDGVSVSGEGSLSFGFRGLEVGAFQVIASLWNVEDASSAKLIKEYYRSLKQGFSSGLALTNAKKHFIESSDNFYKHPFFWAPFVHLGHEIKLKTGRFPYELLILLLLPLFFLKLKIRITY